MNDTARLAAHRELETEGSTTPAQARSGSRSVDDRPRPWTYRWDMVYASWRVHDADGATIASGLSQRDAKLIAGAPDIGALAQQFCDDLDRALMRVGL